jgi:hypothetical protein
VSIDMRQGSPATSSPGTRWHDDADPQLHVGQLVIRRLVIGTAQLKNHVRLSKATWRRHFAGTLPALKTSPRSHLQPAHAIGDI